MIDPHNLAEYVKSQPMMFRDMRPVPTGGGGWYPIVREPFTGAWQRNKEWHLDTVLAPLGGRQGAEAVSNRHCRPSRRLKFSDTCNAEDWRCRNVPG